MFPENTRVLISRWPFLWTVATLRWVPPEAIAKSEPDPKEPTRE
jgi:hypothetical protein